MTKLECHEKTVNLAKTLCLSPDAEPSHLNYVDYIADDVNPQAQLLKQKAQTDDDPSTKREDRFET